MKTECIPSQLEFHALGARDVVGRFDGGRITSDGGGLLLREVDQRVGLLERLAGCFTDYRNPKSIEHSAMMNAASRSLCSNWFRVLTLLAWVAGSVGIATVSHAQSETVSMEVSSGRPVAEAIRMLTSRYPVVITYEDPRYGYSGDIEDVTEEVRNPLSDGAQSSESRVLVPKGGALGFSYEAIVDTDGRPADIRNTLQAILNANISSSFPGRFRIEQAGDVFHVIPTQVRNERGDWVTRTPVLDTRITLPRQEMNGYQMLEAITDAVSEATGIGIGLGLGGLNPYYYHNGYLEANNEVARDVLLRTLHAIDQRFTWRLLYGPDVKSYALNVRVVEAPRPQPVPLEPPSADPDQQPPQFRER